MKRSFAHIAIVLFLIVPLSALISSLSPDKNLKVSSLNACGDVEDTDDVPSSKDADDDERFEIVTTFDFRFAPTVILSASSGHVVDQLEIQHEGEVKTPPPRA
jgi:hypothetical protein